MQPARLRRNGGGAGRRPGALGCPAIVRAQVETLRVGHLTPRTGFLGQLRDDGFKAAAIAIEETNSGGGVLGRRIELIAEDNVNRGVAVATEPKLVDRARSCACWARTDRLRRSPSPSGEPPQDPLHQTAPTPTSCMGRTQPLHVSRRRLQHHVHEDHRRGLLHGRDVLRALARART